MVRRCYDQSRAAYVYYGGRGIAVCDRWLVGTPRGRGFRNFVADMGDRPTGTTLERIDNDGNYSPENCKWGTFGEQHRNRRSNTWITYNGETLIAKDWQNRTGIRADVITRRIARGVPLHEALTLKRTPRPAPTAMIEAAAKARRARTECKNGHPLSGDNLYVQPNGARVCKTCKHASYLTRRSAGKKA